MSSKLLWITVVLFLVTRLCLLADYPHFFDSPEYFRESQAIDFFTSIASSHEAVHPVYLLVIQTLQRAYYLLTGSMSIIPVSLTSALFGGLGIGMFYLLIKRLFDSKTALFASIPLLFFPHSWLLHTNVMHELVEQSLFITGLVTFDVFLTTRRWQWWFLCICVWSLAILNFLGILLWFPVVLGVVFLRSQKDLILKNSCYAVMAGVVSCALGIILLYVLLLPSIPNPLERVHWLIFGFGGGGIFADWSLATVARVFRNSLFIIYYGYSPAALLASILFVGYAYHRKLYKVLWFFLVFFLPFFLSSKFWIGGLFGRYGALVAYPLALAMALLPWKKLYWISLAIVFGWWVTTVSVYKQPPVTTLQAQLLKQVISTPNDLVLLSEYQRPQLPYPNALYVNGSREDTDKIVAVVEVALRENRRVFITQQAMTFPYWQYDGQQLHIISKGSSTKASLYQYISQKQLKLVTGMPEYPLLNIYLIEN